MGGTNVACVDQPADQHLQRLVVGPATHVDQEPGAPASAPERQNICWSPNRLQTMTSRDWLETLWR